MSNSHISFPRVFFIAFGALALVSGFYLGTFFPVSQMILLGALAVYAAILLAVPYGWLILLPVFCVTINLAPYTGRFIFNELDLVFLVTVGAAGIRSGFSREWKSFFPGWLVLAYILLILVPVATVPYGELLFPSKGNPYYSSLYYYQVAKGILIGFVLSLYLRQEVLDNPVRTMKSLVVGAWLASVALFMIVLWERGTLELLLTSTDPYKIANSFLNLSTTYRVTGLLADMHTGGESLDGWFLLLLPLNLLGIFVFRTQKPKLMSVLCLGFVFYCVVMGFTRATYAASAISIAVFVALALYRNSRAGKSAVPHVSLVEFILFTGFALGLWFVYKVTGFYVLIAGGVLLFGGLAVARNRDRLGQFYWLGLVAVALMAAFINYDSFVDSKWVDDSPENRIRLLVGTAVIIALSAFLYGRQKVQNGRLYLYANLFTLMLAFALCLVLGGSRIQTRMETVENDWQTRMNHWSSVIASSPWSWSDHIFGNGLGSFTANYLVYNPDLVREVGSFSIYESGLDGQVLTIGPGGDQVIGQRVKADAGQDYQVDIEARASDEMEIRVAFCERNLIIFDRWDVNCSGKTLSINPADEFESYTVKLNAKNVGKPPAIGKLPTLFIVRPKKGESLLEVKSVSISAPSGKALLENGNFEAGMDHWFFYHDFKHLPWHIKNIYLSIYYQLGALGILLFFLMFATLMKRSIRSSGEHSMLWVATASMVVSYLAFGMFGDPLDSPRVNWMFYLLLFLAVCRDRKTGGKPSTVNRGAAVS
ncbi:hypothetical protein BTA51_10375 [Hahella sp. CCB-MM4]|uniref:hypothetical protein n=1 Tax=Hahella sp. (strain CCB-MM4) TaxID=1926491 RepID=UPI000B9B25F6|nr:hypothetical protein [Hahella sp. CCB-MM4]OZG73422.1 hypothetical protein BTA51_10375 [Hahella sp. CCB-MM4]